MGAVGVQSPATIIQARSSVLFWFAPQVSRDVSPDPAVPAASG